jgi:hypothetical protein
MNPGRPVASAANITPANGTRYPAPRKADTPTSGKKFVPCAAVRNSPPMARPNSAPSMTSGMNSPPAPPPATVSTVAAARSTSSRRTRATARRGSKAQRRLS